MISSRAQHSQRSWLLKGVGRRLRARDAVGKQARSMWLVTLRVEDAHKPRNAEKTQDTDQSTVQWFSICLAFMRSWVPFSPYLQERPRRGSVFSHRTLRRSIDPLAIHLAFTCGSLVQPSTVPTKDKLHCFQTQALWSQSTM